MVPDLPKRRGRGSSRASPVLQGILPLEGSRVPAEALAGLTLAAVGIPEVLGYAKIAGMPLVTGLYTMLLPMALYAVLGSSRHLVVAADSATTTRWRDEPRTAYNAIGRSIVYKPVTRGIPAILA